MYRITLSNLQEATAQQIFDRICAHLFTQMVKSEDSRGRCRYRQNTEGLSCAVGCLMADDEYRPEWEGMGWGTVIIEWRVTDRHSYLLRNMQYLHDNFPPKSVVFRNGGRS